jgi:hypothetical protein
MSRDQANVAHSYTPDKSLSNPSTTAAILGPTFWMLCNPLHSICLPSSSAAPGASNLSRTIAANAHFLKFCPRFAQQLPSTVHAAHDEDLGKDLPPGDLEEVA